MEKWLIITLVSAGGTVVLGGIIGVLLYLRYLRKKIVHDYALEPEKFLEKRKIPIAKKINYAQWGFKAGNDCTVKKEKGYFFLYFRASWRVFSCKI